MTAKNNPRSRSLAARPGSAVPLNKKMLTALAMKDQAYSASKLTEILEE